jgi:predicted membrane protein
MDTVAVATALTAALFFGISSVADQRSTKKINTQRKAGSPAILLDLVRQPLWLMAIAANIAGFALQVTALSFGSLAVVQPLLVFDLIFAVLIARSVGWDPNRFPGAKRWDPVVFTGVGLATAGVAGFLAIGQPSAGRADLGFIVLVPLAIGLVVVLGGCLFMAARSPKLRPLALALGCGVCYGVAAFSVKLVTSEFGHGPARVFTNWPIYILAVTGPVGFILNQDAFQQGKFLAPVQAIVTTADPIISIALGVLWLDVALRNSPGAVAGEVISLLVMTLGIVVTARHSPQCAPQCDPQVAQSTSANLAGEGSARSPGGSSGGQGGDGTEVGGARRAAADTRPGR